MRVRRLVMTLAILAGTFAGVAPVGTAANADNCDNPVRLYFWYGRRVVTPVANPTTGNPVAVSASNPVNIDSRYVNCSAAPGVVQNKPVWPGATAVSGRADQKPCQSTGGHIVGLGVNDHTTWTPPVDALGACNAAVGTTGARTVLIDMDPTQLGPIEAWTDDVGFGERVIYVTVDR